MYKFNLSNIDEKNLKIVEDYLIQERISSEFLEHFARISFQLDFYENTNNDYLLEITELSIIYFNIFLENKELILEIFCLNDEENILKILQNSIKKELITRFKNKIENNLNKYIYKIDKIKKI